MRTQSTFFASLLCLSQCTTPAGLFIAGYLHRGQKFISHFAISGKWFSFIYKFLGIEASYLLKGHFKRGYGREQLKWCQNTTQTKTCVEKTAIFLLTSRFISTQRSRRYSNQHAGILEINLIVVEKKKRWGLWNTTQTKTPNTTPTLTCRHG
jgi:hypothetical protein